MAIVAVQQPGQRETQLDAIAKALNIAQSVYGIKTSYEQMQLMKAREERMADAETAQEERAKRTFGLQEKEYQRKEAESNLDAAVIKAGALKPVEFAQRYMEVDPKQRETLKKMFGGVDPVVKAKVWKYGTKEGEPNFEEKYAIPMETYNLYIKSKFDTQNKNKEGVDWKSQIRLDNSMKQLYKEQELAGIGTIFEALSGLENSMPGGFEGGEDIGGTGATRDLPQFMLTPEGKNVRAQLENLTDLILRQRTGAAYGAHEAEKIQKILGNIRFGSDADLRQALMNLKTNMYNYNKRIEASLPDKNAIPEVAAGGGFTSLHPFWSTGLGALRQTNQGTSTPTVRYNKGGATPAKPLQQQGQTKFTPDSNRASGLKILRE
jgi:hypothetical protein